VLATATSPRSGAVAAAAALVLAGCGTTISARTSPPAHPVDRAPAPRVSSLALRAPAPAPPPRSSIPLTPKIRTGVFTLGDSVMLGARSALMAHHYRVDAVVGRQFFEGILELRAVNRTGALPRNVVAHLGTNGTIATKHCEAMVATAGPSRRLFFVTVFGPRSWMHADDVVLRAGAARHRVNVVIIDWAGLVARHPAWLGPDHIHPNTVGHRAYTALIVSAVSRYGI
jgi:hypothetical protein